MTRGPRGFVGALGAILLASRLAGAKPLQDVVQETKPGVVHLSVLDDEGEEVASGSGFIVGREGRVATNFHVIDGAKHLRAAFPGGKTVEVRTVLGYDADSDVAVLALAEGTYAPLTLSGAPPHEGDEVIVIGSPRGLAGSVSTGIVSAIRASGAKFGDESYASWTLQISAPISPGSSGSPVLNANGAVIGLAVGAQGGQALNFAVPVSKLAAVLAAPLAPHELPVTKETRSVRRNLTISAGVLGGLSCIWWIVAKLLDRKRRRGAHTGLEIVERR